VFLVEALPYSLIEDIYIAPTQCWILMALIVSIILLVEQKRFYYFAAAFVFTIGFTFLQWMHFREDVNTRKLIVYNVRGHSAIDLIDCGQACFLSHTGLQNDPVQMRFHIRPNRIISGVDAVDINPLSLSRKVVGGELLAWKGITLLHITTKEFRLPSSMHADGIVISNNALSNIGLLKDFRGRIILDSSNSLAFASRVLEQAREHHLTVYSVLHQGAFEIQLSSFHT
jgi:competence protein ComEC